MTALLTRPDTTALTHRQRAILRAVAAGRAEVSCNCESTLFVDGLVCCDSTAARQLTTAGLLAVGVGRIGTRVPAELTPAGLAALLDG